MNTLKQLLFLIFFPTLICTVTCASCQEKQKDEIEISADQFIHQIKEGNYVLLDVRTGREYKSGHLKEALLFDVSTSGTAERLINLDRTKKYYVYCQSGIRSRSVVKFMRKEGFSKSFNITGGILELKKRGIQLIQ